MAALAASRCACPGVLPAQPPPRRQCSSVELPPARRNGRLGSAGAAAAAKRTAGGARGGAQRKSKKQLDEVALFEQLMADWDDAFAADCSDTDKAARVARLAGEGYRQHGRGFVFVRSTLERRSRKSSKYVDGNGSSGGAGGGAAKGFGAAAQRPEQGTLLPTNAQLRLLSWTASYVPGAALDGGVGGLFTAGEGGTVLPDSGSLLAGGGGGGGGGEVAALQELQRVMRGQDPSQLRALVGLPPPGVPPGSDSGSGSGSGSADAAAGGGAAAAENAAAALPAAEGGMMGLRRYEPEQGELVVLLSARISGKPALGAELLVVAQNEEGATVLQLPDGWEAALAAA